MSLTCPACKLGAERHGFEFSGGYLYESREFVALLHWNFCGAYYQRKTCTEPLRRVTARELSEHRRVAS